MTNKDAELLSAAVDIYTDDCEPSKLEKWSEHLMSSRDSSVIELISFLMTMDDEKPA